ncbi:hypothetical protein D3C76_1724190 [compost metagenome]
MREYRRHLGKIEDGAKTSIIRHNGFPYANGLLAVLSQPPETIPALPPSARRCCEYSNLIRP